jgi:hypothetical protein
VSALRPTRRLGVLDGPLPKPPPLTGEYARIVGALARYLSPLMARSVADRALSACGLDAARLGPRDMPRVVESARVGVGMFCNPEDLPKLMLELAELCDGLPEANATPRRT